MNRDSNRVALIVVGALIGVKIGLHLWANALPYYEFHRDEFLYFAMGEHLHLFGMDFPPFIAIVSEVFRGLFGDSLVAIRMAPAITGAGLMLVSAATARALGGKVFAQGLAALSVLCSLLFLRSGNLFQPVVFDQLWWTLGLYFLLRLGLSGNPKWWLWFGFATGLGLLTKFSILIFGFGVFVALIATHERRWLATRWPWLAAGIAVMLGCPSIIGQIVLGWPVFGQIEAINRQFEQVSFLSFVFDQPMLAGGFFLAIIGCVQLIRGKFGESLRLVGVAPLAAFLTLMLLHGKSYYIGPIYPVLMGVGSVVIGRIEHGRVGGAVRGVSVAFLVVFAVVALPIGLPVLKPEAMEAYLVRVGLQERAATTNVGDQGRIPQDYADMLDWKQQVEAVARAYNGLSDAERSKAVILGSNYGEAGAIDFYGPALGLPRAIATVGTYWEFGPGDLPGEVLICAGCDLDDLEHYFDELELTETVSHPFAVAEERNVQIFVCRQPKFGSLQELWPSFEGQH